MHSILEARSLRGAAVLAATLFVGGAAAIGQESPYVGLEARPIKSLSEDRQRDYLEGAGMGFALAGELNGYPGPKHVLELQQELGLSLQQLERVQEIFDAMRDEAMHLGTEIVEREGRLDEAFASRAIDAVSLARITEEIGRLNGRLRGAHLRAHLETAALLSPHQRVLYGQLRGYGAGGEHGRHH